VYTLLINSLLENIYRFLTKKIRETFQGNIWREQKILMRKNLKEKSLRKNNKN